MPLSPGQQSEVLNLARAVIRGALGACDPIPPPSADPLLQDPGSCFVTLHRHDNQALRGCIGQIVASGPLRQSLIEMAQAVLDDPRFGDDPVTLEELPQLELEVTILSPLEKAGSPLDFDLLNQGIYLRCAGETGCFLPQVARETGWTKEQLLNHLCLEKMGLPAGSWKRPDAMLYRFGATIAGPEPF